MKRATTGKVEIPEGGRKEAELLFHREIMNYIEKYQIRPKVPDL